MLETPAQAPIDLALLRRRVEELSAIRRPSASEGERVAAQWVVERFVELGISARIEEERVHGEFWRPLALMCGTGALAGLASLRGRRALATTVSAAAAAGIWDDLTGGQRYFRKLLPSRRAYNVVAELGPRDARRTVVVVAHHDAAHSGLIFHPGIPAFVWRHFPQLIENNDTSPPLMFPVLAGP